MTPFNLCIPFALFLVTYITAESDIAIAAVADSIRDNVVPLADDMASSCVACRKSANTRLSAGEMHAKKIEQEKHKILSKLQLNDPPNVTLDQHDIPSVLRKRMADDFSKTNSFNPETDYETDEDMSGKTRGFFIIGEYSKRGSKNMQCFSKEGKLAGCFDLKISHEISMKQILNATLYMYKVMTPDDDPSRNHVLRIAELHRHNHKLVPDEEVVAEVATTIEEGWIEVDISSLVESWRHRKYPSKRHITLQITCVTCPSSVTLPISSDVDQRPYVEITTGVAANNRKKRSNLCSPELYSNCCLKSFYVNFTEIGWNTWIIQPAGYHANYCTGSCRMTSTTSYNSVVRKVALTKEIRGENYDRELIPCCSPTKMSPLSLLYAFNSGEIRKKVLGNMIVRSCGC